ncbi:hypothetical protein [Nonomuraea sp. KM90]|uniref:hypothetical protein n=1 Tax=Nonomuraea sp. KM90 TaxID=3457428 RepID=UPI003FCE1C55
MTRFRTALAPLAIALLGLTAVPQQAWAAPPKPVPPVQGKQAATAASPCAPTVTGATTNARLTSLFTTHGNDNSSLNDWTGADGTYSLRLPSGRELWVFSDTFLGRVNPDGSRPPVVEEGGTTVFLNNSFAVERDGRLSTIHDGTAAKPEAVMPPRDKNHWYWAGDATLAGGIVEVTYQEYERYGPGAWDWRWHRNVLARFAPGRLQQPISVHDLPSGHGAPGPPGPSRTGVTPTSTGWRTSARPSTCTSPGSRGRACSAPGSTSRPTAPGRRARPTRRA